MTRLETLKYRERNAMEAIKQHQHELRMIRDEIRAEIRATELSRGPNSPNVCENCNRPIPINEDYCDACVSGDYVPEIWK